MTDDPRKHSGLAKFAIEALSLFLLGWTVAFVFWLLHDFELLRALDRTVTDGLMREGARNHLASRVPHSTAPRFVFVDIGEESCRQWAGKKTSCALGMITPRDHLAEIANAISAAAEDRGGPKLVVFDIEFAPQPGEGTPNGADKKLCSAILKLADKVDVIALRPMVVDPHSLGSGKIGFPSILDREFAQKSSCEPVGALQKKRLWFASPLIESDPDGVVRSVYAWHEILIEDTQQHGVIQRGVIPGVGFLGAALLDSHPQSEVLRCYFDASNSLGTSISNTRQTGSGCEGRPIWIGNQRYAPTPAPLAKIDRIFFSLPYQNQTGGASDAEDYPIVPSQIETVEAYTFDRRLKETPTLLTGAIVVVGASSWSSGDHRAVPLNASMPGAMVQANAIQAYAMPTIVNESFSWGVKFVLITAASLTGALFKCIASWAEGAAGPGKAFLIQLPIAVAGVVVSVTIVLFFGIAWAFQELTMTGTALGTVTPALAVALEGGCPIFKDLEDQLSKGIVKTYSWLNNLNWHSK